MTERDVVHPKQLVSLHIKQDNLNGHFYVQHFSFLHCSITGFGRPPWFYKSLGHVFPKDISFLWLILIGKGKGCAFTGCQTGKVDWTKTAVLLSQISSIDIVYFADWVKTEKQQMFKFIRVKIS